MPLGLGLRDWGSLVGRPVTHLFFQLVPVPLMPLGAPDLVGMAQKGEDGGLGGFAWQSRACRLYSHGWVWVAYWGL